MCADMLEKVFLCVWGRELLCMVRFAHGIICFKLGADTLRVFVEMPPFWGWPWRELYERLFLFHFRFKVGNCFNYDFLPFLFLPFGVGQ